MVYFFKHPFFSAFSRTHLPVSQSHKCFLADMTGRILRSAKLLQFIAATEGSPADYGILSQYNRFKLSAVEKRLFTHQAAFRDYNFFQLAAAFKSTWVDLL